MGCLAWVLGPAYEMGVRFVSPKGGESGWVWVILLILGPTYEEGAGFVSPEGGDREGLRSPGLGSGTCLLGGYHVHDPWGWGTQRSLGCLAQVLGLTC